MSLAPGLLLACDSGAPDPLPRLDELEASVAELESSGRREVTVEPIPFEAPPYLSQAFIDESGRELAEAMRSPDAGALMKRRIDFSHLQDLCPLVDPWGEFILEAPHGLEEGLSAAFDPCVPGGKIVSVKAEVEPDAGLELDCGGLVRTYKIAYAVETSEGRAGIEAELHLRADGNWGWSWGIDPMPVCVRSLRPDLSAVDLGPAPTLPDAFRNSPGSYRDELEESLGAGYEAAKAECRTLSKADHRGRTWAEARTLVATRDSDRDLCWFGAFRSERLSRVFVELGDLDASRTQLETAWGPGTDDVWTNGAEHVRARLTEDQRHGVFGMSEFAVLSFDTFMPLGDLFGPEGIRVSDRPALLGLRNDTFAESYESASCYALEDDLTTTRVELCPGNVEHGLEPLTLGISINDGGVIRSVHAHFEFEPGTDLAPIEALLLRAYGDPTERKDDEGVDLTWERGDTRIFASAAWDDEDPQLFVSESSTVKCEEQPGHEHCRTADFDGWTPESADDGTPLIPDDEPLVPSGAEIADETLPDALTGGAVLCMVEHGVQRGQDVSVLVRVNSKQKIIQLRLEPPRDESDLAYEHCLQAEFVDQRAADGPLRVVRYTLKEE